MTDLSAIIILGLISLMIILAIADPFYVKIIRKRIQKKVLGAFNNGEQISFINFGSNTFEKNISKESGYSIVKSKNGFLYFVGNNKVMYLYDCTLQGE